MKRLLIPLLVLMLLTATPAYAFAPPTQGSENATDVILWGDNVTISITGSTTITVSDLEDAMTGAAEAGSEVIAGEMADIAADCLAFVTVAFIIAIVFIKGGTMLTALGVPVAFVYGFTTASSHEVYSAPWVAGVAIGLLGLYFLYQIAASAVTLIIGRLKQ